MNAMTSWTTAYVLHLIIFATLGAVLHGSEDGSSISSCPVQNYILPCRCLQNPRHQIQIRCSHSDLQHVMVALRALQQRVSTAIDDLILEHNLMPSLPGRFFNGLHLRRIMLRDNGLERVSPDWLVGIESTLLEVFLVEPLLRSLPPDSFSHLHNLEAITIRTKLLKRLPSFLNLPKLRFIQFESDNIQNINYGSQPSFHHLPHLQELYISHSPVLERLESDSLTHLPDLTVLNVSHCAVSWLHPRALQMLPRLNSLALNSNRLQDIGMIGRSIRDLPFLRNLYLDFNQFEHISEAAFVDLPYLHTITLSHNRITRIHYGAFHRVPALHTLNLEHNHIDSIHPESFLQPSDTGLQSLWMAHNRISHISEVRSLLDALPRLILLDLSYNFLSEIPFDALHGHPTLERLDLDHNHIHHIDTESLMAMPALRELRLRNNSLHDSTVHFAPFWNLPALKGLDLAHNHFVTLHPALLANVPNLRRLDLSSNHISSIPIDTFLPTEHLEHINLSSNHLSSLQTHLFFELANLYEIDLSNNRLQDISLLNLPHRIEHFYVSHNQISNISPITLPQLRTLDFSHNLVESLPNSTFSKLSKLRRLHFKNNFLIELNQYDLAGMHHLHELDFSSNRLTHVNQNAFSSLPVLKVLRLHSNQISMLIPELFRALIKLQILDVSHNNIATLLPSTFEHQKFLTHLNISHNLLVHLANSTLVGDQLKHVDLSHNRLKTIEGPFAQSLEILDLSHNYLQVLKVTAFVKLLHLKELRLNHNQIEAIDAGSIAVLPSLRTLYLNNNQLRALGRDSLSDLPAMETLRLDANELTFIESTAFSGLSSLLVLNLSRNALSEMHEPLLRHVKSVEVLDLSHNRIVTVGPEFGQLEMLVELKVDANQICDIRGAPFNAMTRLRVLSMTDNRLTRMDEKATHLIRHNLAVLDLTSNPLRCDCALSWLQVWLRESSNTNKDPVCSDGQSVRELSPCDPNNLDRAESTPDLVGCTTITNSPVYAHANWLKVEEEARNKPVNRPAEQPLPGESDYFLQDYVDYAYNDTDDSTSTPGPTTTQQTNSLNNNHVTSGTPTIYATPQSTAVVNKNIPKEIENSPSTSGFTFFGVPLPNLVTDLFHSTPKKQRIVTPTTTPKLSTIKMERGGFRPIVPATLSGFVPSTGPTNQPSITQKTTEIPKTTTSDVPDYEHDLQVEENMAVSAAPQKPPPTSKPTLMAPGAVISNIPSSYQLPRRSTITKLTSATIELEPEKIAEPDAQARRETDTQQAFDDIIITSQPNEADLSWYFESYNQTKSQPYAVDNTIYSRAKYVLHQTDIKTLFLGLLSAIFL